MNANVNTKAVKMVVMVVVVVLVSLLTGCTTPSGDVSLMRFPNGVEVGTMRWGNAGVGVTKTQHGNLHGTIDQQNSQWHSQKTQFEDNRTNDLTNKLTYKQRKNETKRRAKVSRDAIKTGAGIEHVKEIFRSAFGHGDDSYLTREQKAIMRQHAQWKASHGE